MSFQDIKGDPALRVSTGALETVEKFITREFRDGEDVQLRRARVGDIALAVGFQANRMEDPEAERTGMNLSNLDDQGVIKTLIELRHPDASAEELRDIAQQYLEGGMQEIAEEIEKTSVFDYKALIPESRDSDSS